MLFFFSLLLHKVLAGSLAYLQKRSRRERHVVSFVGKKAIYLFELSPAFFDANCLKEPKIETDSDKSLFFLLLLLSLYVE